MPNDYVLHSSSSGLTFNVTTNGNSDLDIIHASISHKGLSSGTSTSRGGTVYRDPATANSRYAKSRRDRLSAAVNSKNAPSKIKAATEDAIERAKDAFKRIVNQLTADELNELASKGEPVKVTIKIGDKGHTVAVDFDY